VILKTLVTGFAAAAVIGGAAAGVTSVASGTIAASSAVQPVVWDIPMPAAPPEDDVANDLTRTVNTLGSGGTFAGKSAYIQGLGRFTGKGVELKYNDAVAKGYLPLTATVDDVIPSPDGASATANVTATLASGEVRSMPLTFVRGGSPTGWQLSSQSLFALGELVG
jgi:hypothetical protein